MKLKLSLFVVAFLTSLSICANEACVTEEGLTLYWEEFTSNGTKQARILRDSSYEGFIGKVTIPSVVQLKLDSGTGESIENIPVTTIGWNAFYGCKNIIGVNIPNGLTTIENNAFDGCAGLVSLELPASIKEIGMGAFNECTGLTSINIPEGLDKIDYGLFYGCTALTSISIPKSVTVIEPIAFLGCTGLVSINFSEGLTTIADGAFTACKSIASLTFPESLKSIGRLAFADCTEVRAITFPETMVSLGIDAFTGCNNLSSINIPKGLTKIEEGTFRSCYSLTSIGEIPEEVTSIGPYAFMDCPITSLNLHDKITSIGEAAFMSGQMSTLTFPESLTEIGRAAFLGCPIKELYLSSKTFYSIDLAPVFCSSDFDTPSFEYYVDNSRIVDLVIPDDITSFVNWNFIAACFLYNTVRSIDTGKGITEIKYSGNIDYPVMMYPTILTIGENVTSIDIQFPKVGVVRSHAATPPVLGDDIFPNCGFGKSGIVIVDTPELETKYQTAAKWNQLQFSNPNNVAEVNVTQPGDISLDILSQCNMMPAKVVSLKVNGAINEQDFDQMRVNMPALLNLDLTNASIKNIPDGALSNKDALCTIKLPSDCETIGANALNGCCNVTSIEIPKSVKTIGQSAFFETGLDAVTFNPGLQTIGEYAFAACPITDLTLYEGMVEIENGAFANCRLTSLTLPQSLQSIGECAFEGHTLNQSITLPESLRTIGNRAFGGQPLTDHLTIPESVSFIGNSAFEGSLISGVSISGSLTELADRIFINCRNLESVYVPDNITSIGSEAFLGCASLVELRLPQRLNSIGISAFRMTPLPWIIIPEGITELNSFVMAECPSLSSLSLPSTTTYLAPYALYNDVALRNLTVKALVPPTVADPSTFDLVNIDKCTISIPTTSYRDYVLSTYWGRFVQLRNDIAVECEGDGVITFDTVEEVENETPAQTRRRAEAMAASRRAEAVAPADNGSTLYIPKNGTVNFYITPAEGESIESATFNGSDVLDKIVDGVFTTTADNKGGKLVVKFSGQRAAVESVTADTDTTPVYYNLQGIRVNNPTNGIYIRRCGNTTTKVAIK